MGEAKRRKKADEALKGARGYRRPPTPLPVERTLRQEAGFGCARCGHPYIEYHHIIPWEEEHHFRPEDMVALCGNCHPAVARFGRDKQYEIKAKPHNIQNGMHNGALVYDKRDLIFRVGGARFKNTPVILRFFDDPIISCSLKEGQAKVSLKLFDKGAKLVFAVEENDVSFRVDDLWDFEYAPDYVIARSAPRDILLEMDFRGDEAAIRAKIWLGARKVEFDRDNTTLPNKGRLSGIGVEGASVGIQVGKPKDRSLPVFYNDA